MTQWVFIKQEIVRQGKHYAMEVTENLEKKKFKKPSARLACKLKMTLQANYITSKSNKNNLDCGSLVRSQTHSILYCQKYA